MNWTLNATDCFGFVASTSTLIIVLIGCLFAVLVFVGNSVIVCQLSRFNPKTSSIIALAALAVGNLFVASGYVVIFTTEELAKLLRSDALMGFSVQSTPFSFPLYRMALTFTTYMLVTAAVLHCIQMGQGRKGGGFSGVVCGIVALIMTMFFAVGLNVPRLFELKVGTDDCGLSRTSLQQGDIFDMPYYRRIYHEIFLTTFDLLGPWICLIALLGVTIWLWSRLKRFGTNMSSRHQREIAEVIIALMVIKLVATIPDILFTLLEWTAERIQQYNAYSTAREVAAVLPVAGAALHLLVYIVICSRFRSGLSGTAASPLPTRKEMTVVDQKA